MIETRLALPVRSPQPLIVPCTWRRPDLDRRERVGDAALGVVVAVDPDAARPQPTADDVLTAVAQRSASGSERPFVSQSVTVSAPASAAAAQAAQRVVAIVAIAVEEVLGVVDHPLARARAGTRPTRRSCAGSPRGRP